MLNVKEGMVVIFPDREQVIEGMKVLHEAGYDFNGKSLYFFSHVNDSNYLELTIGRHKRVTYSTEPYAKENQQDKKIVYFRQVYRTKKSNVR